MAKRGKDKEKAFELLKNKGNLKYNIKILRDGAGQLICVRRQKPGISNDLFLPCVYCFGFYRAYELWRHVKYHCQFAVGESGDSEKQQSCSIQAKARMFLESCVSENFSENGTKLDKEFKTKVLSGMLKDTVYHSVVTDNLILAFGQILYYKLGVRRANNISQRMRQLGRLRKALNSLDQNNSQLDKYITGKGFDRVIQAIYDISELETNNEDIKIFQKPALALRLGHNLTKIAEIKRGKAIREDCSVSELESDRFIRIKNSEWADRVSSIATTTLQTNNFNKPNYLPLTKDIVQLRKHLDEKIERFGHLLEKNPNPSTYRKLSEYLLCLLTLFNKRRGGEVEKLKVQTYKERHNWEETANKEIVDGLKPIEKELFHW